MPPNIALFFGLTFILFLYIVDSRQGPKVTKAVWLPAIWFTIAATRPFSVWIGMETVMEKSDEYLQGSPIDRNFFLVLIFLALIVLFRRREKISEVIRVNKWLFFYLFFCGLSTIWSDFAFVSFKRWIKEIGNFAMALIVITEPNVLAATATVFRRCAIIAMPMSIVFIKYFPSLGRMFTPRGDLMYVGATTHKNSLGILCAFIFTSLIWEWTIARSDSLKLYNKYNRKIGIISYLALLIMALWMLIISNSATSIVASCIGVLVVLLMNFNTFKKKIRYIGRFILITVVIVFIFNTAFDIKGLIFSGLGREATLTGRTEVWEQVLEENTNPLIGTGYESFWLGDRMNRFWATHWWKPNQAHNGYLEVYLNLGIIGLALLIRAITCSYKI